MIHDDMYDVGECVMIVRVPDDDLFLQEGEIIAVPKQGDVLYTVKLDNGRVVKMPAENLNWQVG